MYNDKLINELDYRSIMYHLFQLVIVLALITLSISVVVYFRDYRHINDTTIKQSLEKGDFSRIVGIKQRGFWPCEARRWEPTRFSYAIRGHYDGHYYEALPVCIDKNGAYQVQPEFLYHGNVKIPESYFER